MFWKLGFLLKTEDSNIKEIELCAGFLWLYLFRFSKLNVYVWGRGSREAPYCPSQFWVEVLCDLSGTTSGSVWLVLWFPPNRPRLTSIRRPTLLQMPTSPRNYWTSFSSHVTTSSFEKEPMRVRQPEDSPGRVLTALSLSRVWTRFPGWKEGWVLLIRPTMGS